MNKETMENNKVELAGVIISEPEFMYESYGENFYKMSLGVKRKSGAVDEIPLTISERLFDMEDRYSGMAVRVSGSYRSFNKQEGTRRRLILSVFVCDIEAIDSKDANIDKNCITINGYVCKEPNYRETPLDREITDMLIAVNRDYGKSDYIPCIAWGRNARFAGGFKIGTRVKLIGRIQSREYDKKISDTEFEKKVAYEVSVSKCDVIEEGKMKITIKSIHIENFKGINMLDVNFSVKTKISGQNAVGKTTIFDAFTWLLSTRTVPERKNSMFDRWIRTETALITWKSRCLPFWM